MIVQKLVDALSAVVTWFVGLWPVFDPPGWLSNISDGIHTLGGYVGSTSAWLPWQAVAVVVPVLIAATTVALAIRAARWLQSTFTGGGGSVN